jgi:hypothetical protein
VVFFADLTEIERRLERRTRKLRRTRPSTREEAIAFYAGYNDALAEANSVILQVPESAEREGRRWKKALVATMNLAGEVAEELEGMSTVTPGYARSVERRFMRVEGKLRRRFRELNGAVNEAALPLAPVADPTADEQVS